MKKKVMVLIIFLLVSINVFSQIQISNFTYNDDEAESLNTDFLKYKDKLYFLGGADGFGNELWSTDGTKENTKMLKDIGVGESDGVRSLNSVILNNELFFVANSNLELNTGEIWKTDGTENGTEKIISYEGSLFKLTNVNNTLFFVIKTNPSSYQLWKTDGTSQGTSLVKDSFPTTSSIYYQGKAKNTFIFSFILTSGNSVVWRSDGTSAGTYSITNEIDGNGSGYLNGFGGTSYLTQFIEYKDKLYFVSRSYLYQTDGTKEATKSIASVWNAQNNLVASSDIIELNGKLYLSFFSKELNKLSIYESDGNITTEIYSIKGDKYFFPSLLSKSDDSLQFTSINNNGGTSIFLYNPSTKNFTEIIELDANPADLSAFSPRFSPCKINKMDDVYYFIHMPTRFIGIKEGWMFNKTNKNLNYYSSLDYVFKFEIYNEELFYLKGKQIWKFDSTVLSTNDVLEQGSTINIYPNPVSDLLNFSSGHLIDNISIFNVNGKKIINQKKILNNTINITNLNSGVYILKYNFNGQSFNKKIIKR